MSMNECGAEAASALSTYVQRTDAQRSRILHELTTALRSEDDAITARGVYADLLRILAPNRDVHALPDAFDRHRDVE